MLAAIGEGTCNSTTTRIPYAQGIRPAQVETTTPPAAPAAGSAHQDRACEFVECPMKAEDREKCVSDIDMMPPSNQQHALALLLVDHMRSKTKYIKTIKKWSLELGLTRRLFFGKLILVLLQEARRNIKVYIHIQRTVKVDVDSSGKRCKEKMMRVPCETPVSDLKQLMIFSAVLYEFVS
ncbi:RWD domain-containing protein 3-like [Coregonus clupeaformis]|uniref:RWD domain-containing protein 3-like n=1 Tax=Coregonus clupeaformis TaxID=59861 RepID=UPI001E1C89E6|nr:RWD domain-containing protein 3-like [Coregonus clupeaformis]